MSAWDSWLNGVVKGVCGEVVKWEDSIVGRWYNEGVWCGERVVWWNKMWMKEWIGERVMKWVHKSAVAMLYFSIVISLNQMKKIQEAFLIVKVQDQWSLRKIFNKNLKIIVTS